MVSVCGLRVGCRLFVFFCWLGWLSKCKPNDIYIYSKRERERRSVQCVSGIISFIQITRQNIELNRIKKRNYTNNQPNNNHLLSSPFFVFVFVFYSTFFFHFLFFLLLLLFLTTNYSIILSRVSRGWKR